MVKEILTLKSFELLPLIVGVESWNLGSEVLSKDGNLTTLITFITFAVLQNDFKVEVEVM